MTISLAISGLFQAFDGAMGTLFSELQFISEDKFK